MVNRRAHPKSLRSLLVLIVLALPSPVAWGGTPQDASAEDAGPVPSKWCLLPRTPLSPALRTDGTQSVAEPTEDRAAGSAQARRSKPSESCGGSASTPSHPVSVPQPQLAMPEGQSSAQGYDGPQATDQGSPLDIPSTVVWQRMSQAVTALRTGLGFPSLLPRTPLSPRLWTEDTQTEVEQVEEQAARSAQEGGSKPETRIRSVFAPSLPAAVPLSEDVRPEGHPQVQGHDAVTATDLELPLIIPSTVVWQRVSQAITILHVEPAFPSLLPGSQISSESWTHDAQRVGPQAKKEEKREKETRETAASEPLAILLATSIAPNDQPPVQGQKKSATSGNAGTAVASQKTPALAPTEKGAATPSQVGKSASSGTAISRTSGQPTQGEKGIREKGATSASPTAAVHPSSAAIQKGQPTVQGYHGPGTPDHASAGALEASAGEIPSTRGGTRALRDPFKLPPPPRPEQEEKDDPKLPGNRPPGSRGLLVEQLRLKGVVRDNATQKMIAVVTSNNNRAYFLQEGEAVYDGVVSKITSDAVYFKGNISDAKREVRSREVVKTLSSAPGEAR